MVGLINLGRDPLEILPKIEGAMSQVRHNLPRMISVVLDLELYDDDSVVLYKDVAMRAQGGWADVMGPAAKT